MRSFSTSLGAVGIVVSSILCCGCGDKGNSARLTGQPAATGAAPAATPKGAAAVPAARPAPGTTATGETDGGTNVAIELGVPNATNPVVIGAGLTREQVRPGETTILIIKAKTAPQWHIYSAEGKTGVSRPTKLDVKLPAGFETAGPWRYPQQKRDKDASEETWIYEGELTFARPLKVAANAPPGPFKITCNFAYQACDASSCLPPVATDLNVEGRIQAQ